MSDIKKKLSFLEEFPAVSNETWREKIEKDLKGADFDRKLVWRTDEGLNFQPFYREDNRKEVEFLDAVPNKFPYTRSVKDKDFGWEIRQDITVDDVKTANAKLLTVLDKGASTIGIVTNGKIAGKEDMETLLEGVYLDIAPVSFITGTDALTVLELFVAYCKAKEVSPKGNISIDPVGTLVCTGAYYSALDTDVDTILKAIELADALPEFKVLGVNAAVFHNAGADMIQEMAYALSLGSEYMNLLTEKGAAVEKVLENIHFTFATGTNYFMEMAKYRALRMLWAKIAEAYTGAETEKAAMYIHSETSLWNKTQYDPHVNMLRLTTESMSAALGGVDSLTVHPFDKTFAEGSDFSERISRNAQIILKEEAYLDKVVDPAAGSYYIEELTAQMAEAAWELFSKTETDGGFIANFVNGNIQTAVEKSASKRKLNIARRKEVLLGTNQYPNINEQLKDVDNATPVIENGSVAKPLVCFRASDEFEALRLDTDNADKRPVVFLLTIGNLTMRKARATFAYNFFGCAGYEVIDNLGFETVQSGVDAAKAAGADIIVICSSDDEYETFAPEAYNMVKDDTVFMVAGAPSCTEKLQEQGIQHFIHVKTNVLEKLQETNNLLGIA